MSDRKNIMLGTAGHVDHGKTAVVKMLTGCNLDTLAEEQKRGLTIDLGFAPCRMADERIVGIIDVPGHVDFIRNMVAGAHGIDVVIFVVAADDGVMPQTREHLDILTLMGVRGGIIALTKIDLVPQDLRQIVIDDVRELVAGTFLAAADICPISNITGEGYPSLLDSLNAAVEACPERNTGGLFRSWVEDVHAIKGFGTVATGIPLAGAAAVGDHLTLLPAGRTVRLRKVEVYGQDAAAGRAGECVAMNLADIEAGDLSRGMLLCQGDAFAAVEMAEACITLLPRGGRPLKDYAEVHLHVGTGETTAKIAMLETKELAPGSSQMVQLRLGRPMPVAPGDRFVIRTDLGGSAGGRLTTIGGGRVVSTVNIRLRRNRPWTLEALSQRLAALDQPRDWAAVNLRQSPQAVCAEELARASQMNLAELEPLLDQLLRAGEALDVGGGRYVHVAAVEQVSQRIIEALEQFHQASPHRLGMEEDELAAQLTAPKALVALATASMAAAGKVERHGSVLLLPGRGAKLSVTERQLCEQIEAAMREGRFAPPAVLELAARFGALPKNAEKMARLLVDRGVLVKVDATLVMHRDAVEAAKAVAMELFRKGGGFETVEFRDALGVSRKYAVPLLDYFDTIRLTVRSGSRRTAGTEARKILETNVSPERQ